MGDAIFKRGWRTAAVAAGASVVVVLVGGSSACSDEGQAAPADAAPEAEAGAPRGDGGAWSPAPDADAAEGGPSGPSLNALIYDDAIWKPVQVEGTTCDLREGVVVPDPFPKRTWTSCGGGCLVAEVALPFDELAITVNGTGAGAYLGGEMYLLLPHDAKNGRIVRLERVSDGTTIAAVVDRGPLTSSSCLLPWHGGAAPMLFTIFGSAKDELQFLFGRASTTPGEPIAWHSGWVDDLPVLSQQRFIFDDGYGVATYGGILLLPDPATLQIVDLEGGSGVIHGDGPQLVWGYAAPRIRSYTKAGGAVDLVTLPAGRQVLGSALSADRLVWIDAVRPGEDFADARWRWSPRTTDPASVVVNDGPLVPTRGLVTDVQVVGDWAAVHGAFGTPQGVEGRVFLWNVANGKTYTMPPRPGHGFRRVFAVSPTELLLGEAVASEHQEIQHLVRIQLSALPSLVAQWSN
jgi:hypothetical protein